jgi:hypothetical protein
MCYNDLSQAGYWNGYQSAGAFNGPPAPRTSPRSLVESAVAQLSELHGIKVPDPYCPQRACNERCGPYHISLARTGYAKGHSRQMSSDQTGYIRRRTHVPVV